ncbi:protein-export chaperone SecB [Asaia bogorensis]|uniref:protein-export chaperone SecB n=1 Tax=Asaia bogorensis TaxID=91915 RepID=UPI000EFAAC6C
MMQLRVTKNYVGKLSLKSTKKRDDNLKLNLNVSFSEMSFTTTIDISLVSREGMALTLSFVTEFAVSGISIQELEKTPHPYVNGPTIAYPFLRAFLGTFTLNAGMDPILLPSVNFLALWEKSERKAELDAASNAP